MKVDISTAYGQELYETVLNTIDDGVIVIDKDFRVIFNNKTMVEAVGSKIGERCYEAYRSRKKPCEDCTPLKVFSDGKPRRATRDIQLQDGSTIWIEYSSAPFKDTEGKIIGAVEVARDVTEKKKAEALLKTTLIEKDEILKHLNNELSEAAGYVKTMLPKPITEGILRTDWRFIPSTSLGGDAFGYHWLDEDHFAIYLLDVSGHGVGAALLSVSIINVLRSHALPGIDIREPGQVLCALNKMFPGERHNDMFFTIWYGVYNKLSRNLVYASGGHPPAFLFSETPSEKVLIAQLRTPSFVIGAQPDSTYKEEMHEIRSPSSLYVFSDGVYDIIKADGSIWGFKAFLEYMTKTSRPGRSDMDHLCNYARELKQLDGFDDDFTILEVIF